MPQALDNCVSKLKTKWKSDPASRPKSSKKDEPLAFAICNSTLKLEAEQAVQLESGFGPALVAVAATIKPHLRQRDHELKLVEIDGKEFIEIPIARKGVYRYGKKKLVFNDAFFDKMIENHKLHVTDYNVALDVRHKDSPGALGWLDTSDGGWLEMKGPWLHGYAVPTDDSARDTIKNKRYRYASAEFYFDYKSNQMQKLSTDDLDEVDDEQLFKEADMSPKTIILGKSNVELVENDGAFVLEADGLKVLEGFISGAGDLDTQIKKLTDEASKAADTIVKLEAELKTLQVDDKDDDDDDAIPEAYRLRLETLERENKELQSARMREKVALTLERARTHVDKAGMAHDKVFLDLARAGLLMESIDEGEISVKLEGDSTEDIASFYRNILVAMLENVPGTVPVQGKTENENGRMENVALEYTEDELKSELDNFGEKY